MKLIRSNPFHVTVRLLLSLFAVAALTSTVLGQHRDGSHGMATLHLPGVAVRVAPAPKLGPLTAQVLRPIPAVKPRPMPVRPFPPSTQQGPQRPKPPSKLVFPQLQPGPELGNRGPKSLPQTAELKLKPLGPSKALLKLPQFAAPGAQAAPSTLTFGPDRWNAPKMMQFKWSEPSPTPKVELPLLSDEGSKPGQAAVFPLVPLPSVPKVEPPKQLPAVQAPDRSPTLSPEPASDGPTYAPAGLKRVEFKWQSPDGSSAWMAETSNEWRVDEVDRLSDAAPASSTMHPMEWLEPAHRPEGTSGTGKPDIPAQDMSGAEPVALQWLNPSGNEQSGGVAPANEWLPEKGRKPDVEQGMKLDRDGNQMPAPPIGNGPGLDDWQRWGEVPGVGGGSPFDDPANPYIPPGDGDRGPGGSADPEDRGPILGNMPDPATIGIDWQEPGDRSRGGSKDPWGGPGWIHPGKGLPGSGHVGQDYHFDPVPVYMSPWGKRQKAKEESYKRAEDMARFCDAKAQGPLRYEPDPKPSDCDESSSASDYDQHNEEKERWKKAQADFEREKARMEQLRKWRKENGGCEGALDTGGGFEAPSSAADVDKSKAGGVLVTDPPANQWSSGSSGVDTSNHPNQVSNPGYEGGRGTIDAGVKHDPTLVGDPPQNSGN